MTGKACEDMKFKGNFCFCCTFGEFAGIHPDYWLEEMIRNSVLVCEEEPGDAQCRAWISCRKELLKALKKLPEAYKGTWLVFEYVLPKYKPGTKKAEAESGIRPDVLVVGKDFTTVLEFKQRKLDPDGTVFSGYIAQAGKYVTRLNKYHTMAKETYVAPLVVLTLEKNFLQDRGEYTVCSADRLADALILLNGRTPASLAPEKMRQWLRAI